MSLIASLTQRLARAGLNLPSLSASCWTRNTIVGTTSQLRFKTDQTSNESDAVDDTFSNLPHQDWVKFQRSIAVEGFETGQKTILTAVAKKNRGGKRARQRKEKELEAARKETGAAAALAGGGGQFPALRYSEEETERLLAEAYANIPQRGGSKKTRHLKRERVRWMRVRKLRAKKKHEKVQAHFRRMGKRSRIAREVREIKAGAAEVRARDEAYQKAVLRKWALTMMQGVGEKKSEKEVV